MINDFLRFRREYMPQWNTDIRACLGCGGYGQIVTSHADHHPDCDGSCQFCPIEVQDQDVCPDCGGSGMRKVIDILKDIVENNAE